MKYKVIRQHWGDRQYMEGQEREVKNEADAKELLRMGLIADAKEVEKAAPKPKNKMAKEPANKSE
jgi:hypothetical protein